MEASEFVGVTEAARVLDVDPATVKRRIYRGELPAERVGAIWLIRRSDLETAA
jgi:excisionase family DNA binding protein